ncbi:hypothetical protein F5Y14DRAFT_365185 [Nemania sp. NC0429]|nr:hypothetical protein F5Y14DRAFT_365185 [Nemania sp. NC0429]
MLTMTRLPSDSFLPSGSIDSFDRSVALIPCRNDQPDSVVSPFSLPHSIRQSYFHSPNHIRSPPTNHTSPSYFPESSNSPRHLSPEHPVLETPTRGAAGPFVTSPSMAPVQPGAVSPFGHLSPQTTATLLQRREEYNRRLLENWQAERTHLEASRARAEEMFREERNMMDEERLFWAEQKTQLETEVTDWKQRTEAAEIKIAQLTKLLEPTHQGESNFDGLFDGAANEIAGHRGSSSSVSPGTHGPSPTFQTLAPTIGSTVPASNPFVPLDPRMQSVSPKPDATHKEQQRVPSIDINEVIPGLEGIRLKAPAIQKSTFHDERPLSPTLSSGKGSPSSTKQDLVESQPKILPAVMTQEALRAPEHHRLTMHAGHTPNHSISFSQLPTVDSTAGNTAGSTGTSTPTSPKELEAAPISESREQSNPPRMPDARQELREVHGLSGDTAIYEEAIFEPSSDDPALKGPLCLKNRPASDEIFLRRLSDKLEEVRATDAAPSVLNEKTAADLRKDLAGFRPTLRTIDDAADGHLEDSSEASEDIPLKLKKTSNFGQPLGQIHRTPGL